MTAELEAKFQADLNAINPRADLVEEMRTLWHCGYTAGVLAGQQQALSAIDKATARPQDHDHIE